MISLTKSKKFFEKYRLGLKAIDLFGNIIYKYPDDKDLETFNYSHKITPRTLYVLIHNNHCYKLTCNKNSFEQLITDIKKYQQEIEPSYKFPTYKEDTKAYRTVFIKQLFSTSSLNTKDFPTSERELHSLNPRLIKTTTSSKTATSTLYRQVFPR